MGFYAVDFGADYSGLSTVGVVQLSSDGMAVVARSSDVVALGHGAYGATLTPDPLAVALMWDTGGIDPIYAFEDLPALTADAIVAALQSAVIPVDAVKMNGAPILGDGSEANKWRGVGV